MRSSFGPSSSLRAKSSSSEIFGRAWVGVWRSSETRCSATSRASRSLSTRVQRLAGLGHRREPDQPHRRRRPGRVDALTAIVLHRAHASVRGADHDRVARTQRAVLHQDRRNGTAPLVEFRFQHDAPRTPRRIGAQLEHVGLQQHHLEQLIEPGALDRGHVHADRLAAEILRHEAVLHQALAAELRIRVGQVALVDRDDQRDPGCLGVPDRLDRLRHDALGRGHHEDHDVGDLGAARAHQREGGVARRVDEGDAALAQRDLVGADVLGDPARLARNHVGLADRVEQRRLAVVDVSHHGDDRRARLQVGGVARGRRLADHLGFLEADVLYLESVLARDLAGRLEIELLVHRRHDAERHQAPLDLGGLGAELMRQLRHTDASLGAHESLGGLRRSCSSRSQRGPLVALSAARRLHHARIDRGRAAHGPAHGLLRELLLLAQVHHFAYALALLALARRSGRRTEIGRAIDRSARTLRAAARRDERPPRPARTGTLRLRVLRSPPRTARARRPRLAELLAGDSPRSVGTLESARARAPLRRWAPRRAAGREPAPERAPARACGVGSRRRRPGPRRGVR